MINKTQLLILPFVLCLFTTCVRFQTFEEQIVIQAVVDDPSLDLSGATVEITDLRSQSVNKLTLDPQGACQIKLERGVFNILIEKKESNSIIFGLLESISIKEEETISVPVSKITMKQPKLIFKEIFFNGSTYQTLRMSDDQYFVLFNNNDYPVYADGIVLAYAEHFSSQAKNRFNEILPQAVVASLMYAIPGDGTTYPVAPGGQLVIAVKAINHGETPFETVDELTGEKKQEKFSFMADLSGADFELYDEKMRGHIDNPEVPNMVRYFNNQNGVNLSARGVEVAFLFHPEEAIDSFLEKNKFEYENSAGRKYLLYKVPTELIMDGIETCEDSSLNTKALPVAVDKSVQFVSGIYKQEVIERKSFQKNGRTYLVDTNDSAADCIIRKGQSSFPKKKK